MRSTFDRATLRLALASLLLRRGAPQRAARRVLLELRPLLERGLERRVALPLGDAHDGAPELLQLWRERALLRPARLEQVEQPAQVEAAQEADLQQPGHHPG